MATKGSNSLVILETVDRKDILPYLVPRASEAIDLLWNVLPSSTETANDFPEPEVVDSIRKLKNAVTESKQYIYGFATPVWNNFTEHDLELVGLNPKQIQTLRSILPVKTAHRAEDNSKHELIPQLLYTLKVLDYDEPAFVNFVPDMKKYPSVGMMICQILSDDDLLDKTRLFLNTDSLDKKREILLQYLKKELQSCNDPRIFHFASACGDKIKSIMPDEISIDFYWCKLGKGDLVAVAKIASNSLSIKMMRLQLCDLNDESVAALRDGLNETNVKIHHLNVFGNRQIGVNGWSCIGDLVKNHEVEELDMSWCGLTYENMDAFNKISGNRRIRHLNVSGNRKTDVNGWSCIGDLVKNHEVEELDISWCDPTYEKVDAFNKSSRNCKIRHLNVSGNYQIGVNGWSCIGDLVKNHEVEELGMSLCGLTYEKVDAFNKCSGNHKIRHLGVSGNQQIDINGWSCIGDLVKNHEVEELDMSGCGLTYEKVDAFNRSSRNHKIRELHLGITQALPPEQFDLTLAAVAELSLRVTKLLDIQNIFQSQYRRYQLDGIKQTVEGLVFLQDFIHMKHPSELKIRCDSWYSDPLILDSNDSEENFLQRLKSRRGIRKWLRASQTKMRLDERSHDSGIGSSSQWTAGSTGVRSHDSGIGRSSEPTAYSIRSYDSGIGSSSEPTAYSIRSHDSGIGSSSEPSSYSIRSYDSGIGSSSGPSSYRVRSYESGIGSSSEPTAYNSEIFNVSNGQIQLSPVESRMQTYRTRFPMIDWSVIPGNDPEGELPRTAGDIKLQPDTFEKVVSSEREDSADDSDIQSLSLGEEKLVLKEGPSHSKKFVHGHDSKIVFHESNTETRVPYEEMVAEVDQNEKLFEVGGCSVYFPPLCFDERQKVSVSAEIDPSNWPPGIPAIAPCLHVKAVNLQRSATIMLSTWCVKEEDVDSTVDVMHYDCDTNTWDVIHSCQLGSSRTISFECKRFSLLGAFWRKLFPRKYPLMPVVYLSEQKFAVAIMLDQKMIIDSCLEKTTENFGCYVKPFELTVFTCKANYKIHSHLFCAVPKHGFQFYPDGSFAHAVQDVIETTKPSYSWATLDSKRKSMKLILGVEIMKNDIEIQHHGIAHYWKPCDSHQIGASSLIGGSEANCEREGVSAEAARIDEGGPTTCDLQLTEGNTSLSEAVGDNAQSHSSGNIEMSSTSEECAQVQEDLVSGLRSPASSKESLRDHTTINVIGGNPTIIAGHGTNENFASATVRTVNKGSLHSEKKDCQEHFNSTLKK